MKHDWEYKKLGEVCEVYQPKTLSSSEMIEDGKYFVYGANGIIGKYDKYNHEESEVLLTCRGATCGTINVSEPFSWINGNAMVVHPEKDVICQSFLKYYLSSYDMSLVITGAAQPQITRQSLNPVPIPLPPLSTQQSIVSELDSLSKIIADCKETLKDYDALEQSIFYDMFGDPVKNEKGWEVKKIEDIGSCCSGGTPSRSHPEYFEGDIIWYSAGELNDLYLGESIEKITESALNNSSAKLCKAGSLFVGMYDTAAFKMGIATVDSCSNQACANVTLNDNNNVIWLYFTLLFMKEEALKNRHGARQKNLNLGYIKNFNIPVPPLPLQQQFASKIEAIEQMKEETKKALQEAETLFQARMDYWFN